MSVDQDLLIGYALGHLAPREEAEVAGYLAAHPGDATLVSGYLESLADFALELTPEPLPETGEADLLARVRGETAATTPPTPVTPDVQTDTATDPAPPPVIVVPTRPRPALWWLAGLGAAAVAALLYFGILSLVGPDVTYTRELEQYQAEPGAVSYTLTQENRTEPLGTLVRLQNGRVFVSLKSPPAENRVYQAWNIGDAAVSLGTFTDRSFLSQAEIPVGNTFGLSLEPPGGSDQPTTTPLTLTAL